MELIFLIFLHLIIILFLFRIHLVEVIHDWISVFVERDPLGLRLRRDKQLLLLVWSQLGKQCLLLLFVKIAHFSQNGTNLLQSQTISIRLLQLVLVLVAINELAIQVLLLIERVALLEARIHNVL